MYQYLEAIQCIMDDGQDVSDRTGVGTRTIFGYQMRFNLMESFPAVTTKKTCLEKRSGRVVVVLGRINIRL
jgi:thymidylate synthase